MKKFLTILLLSLGFCLPAKAQISSRVTATSIKNAMSCADTSVSANTITCSTFQGLTGYSTGETFFVQVANTTTGATTININSLGAKNVTKNGTTAIASGDLVANGNYAMRYDGTEFVVLGSISTGGTASFGFTPSLTSTTLLTVGAECPTSTACTVRKDNNVAQITTSGTATLSGTGNGDVKYYIDFSTSPPTAQVRFHATSGTVTVTCNANCNATDPGATPVFPSQSYPVADVQVASGLYTTMTDDRSPNSVAAYTAGTGLLDALTNGNHVFSLDPNPTLTTLNVSGAITVGSCTGCGSGVTGSQFQVVTMTGTNVAAGNANILTDASNDLTVSTPVGAAVANSPSIGVSGVYQATSTPTFAPDIYSFTNVVSPGTNGNTVFTMNHSGSTAQPSYNFSQATGLSKLSNDWELNSTKIAMFNGGGANFTFGGLSESGTNIAAGNAVISPNVGTGSGAPGFDEFQADIFSSVSGTTGHTQTDRMLLGGAVAGSTTNTTSTNVYTGKTMTAGQGDSETVTVSVQATDGSNNICIANAEFSWSSVFNGTTVTSNTGSLAATSSVCTTGTLSFTVAVSSAASPVVSVTPTWATIVPTGVVITFNRNIGTEH